MLSFTSSLSPDCEAFAIFVTEKYDYKDKKDVRRFVKQKLESANWFVDAVEQRKMTIQRVMESIIRHQPMYFHTDERTLQPMILKDILQVKKSG